MYQELLSKQLRPEYRAIQEDEQKRLDNATRASVAAAQVGVGIATGGTSLLAQGAIDVGIAAIGEAELVKERRQTVGEAVQNVALEGAGAAILVPAAGFVLRKTFQSAPVRAIAEQAGEFYTSARRLGTDSALELA